MTSVIKFTAEIPQRHLTTAAYIQQSDIRCWAM